MSFLGGAECSTAANPLSQFAKHTQADRTLQRERLDNGQGYTQGFRSQPTEDPNARWDALLQESPLEIQPYVPSSGSTGFQASLATSHTQAGPAIAGRNIWAQEYTPGFDHIDAVREILAKPRASRPGADFSPGEFALYQRLLHDEEQRRAARSLDSATQLQPRPNTVPHMPSPMGMGINRMGMGIGGFRTAFPVMRSENPIHGGLDHTPGTIEGKGKLVELDDRKWEEQFAQIDLRNHMQQEGQAAETEVDQRNKTMPNSETNHGDFESIWKGIQAENGDNGEFSTMTDDLDLWKGFDDFGIHDQRTELGEYMFEQDNMFQDIANPFDEGVRIMHEGGNLSLAALAFEAAVQKDPNHLQAWLHLGAAQAQNEKETPAIRALEKALLLDSNNLNALMGLSISYTNEGYDSSAYRTLERWLSVKYPTILAPKDTYSISDLDIGFIDRKEHHDRVTALFIRAAQLSPDAETMDPDVQVGLGVLFYGAEEYAKAVDCFSTALASTESGTANGEDQIHLLWNRLGATLANSGKSEEAINAYEQALIRKPNFVRARYNLGVSCINMSCHEQAAGHFLGALAMHADGERRGRERARELFNGTSGGAGTQEAVFQSVERAIAMNQSTNLYDTLRRVFSQMGRRDLAEKVLPGLDVEEFRREFEF